MENITSQEVLQKLNKGEILNIIDVRETFEVATGKIPSATNIPLGQIDSRMNELDKKKEYIIVCASGGRSASATQFLANQGYHVTNMLGGMMSWVGPVE